MFSVCSFVPISGILRFPSRGGQSHSDSICSPRHRVVNFIKLQNLQSLLARAFRERYTYWRNCKVFTVRSQEAKLALHFWEEPVQRRCGMYSMCTITAPSKLWVILQTSLEPIIFAKAGMVNVVGGYSSAGCLTAMLLSMF